MKFKVFIIKILTLVLSLSANAQFSEIGVFGGGSYFIGDVGDYGLQLPKGYAAGIFYKYNFDRHWAVRAQVNYGFIQNSDSESDLEYRVNRNLSFQSEIWEASLMAEFNFLRFEPGTRDNKTPYLVGGWGVFKFNPQAEYNGELHDLRPLATEGQLTTENSDGFYNLGSHFFIFGLGYKWAIGDITTIGIEGTFRSTKTDYLDDVSGYYADPDVIEQEYGSVAAALSDRSLSQTEKADTYRGNPQTDDWYIFTGITIQFRFEDLYEKCANFVGQ